MNIIDFTYRVFVDRKFKLTLIFYYLNLKFKKKLKIDFESYNNLSSKLIIDIVLITTQKDFDMLESVLFSLKNINHKIKNIYIVAPKGKFIEKFCKCHKYIFINEETVLGYNKNKNQIIVNGKNRSGWIFQQLLKLSGDKFVEQDNYFIIDSDTILINKINLMEKEKFIFFQNEEWNNPYFEAFERLFKYKARTKLSFTSHMMIFNKHKLRQMKEEIEKKFHCRWDDAYVKCIDMKNESSISDYETYANWMLCNYPTEIIQKPFYNKAINRLFFIENKQIPNKMKKRFNSLSFHSYIKS